MAAQWRTVRVFISSTFRDMHSERDYLVKVVFPALRERLEPHRVHLVDIDLRWGITEEQAENDQVLDLCLNQIDECRPFFLGLLGERYGWVPEELPDDKSKHGWTQLHTGKSVTELEILWGVLLKEKMHDHGLFFFRDPAYVSDVPEAKRSEVEAESPDSAQKLKTLKQQIRDANLPIPIMEDYPCQYAGLGIKWGLAKFDLNEADIEALEEVADDGLVDNDEYAGLDERLRSIVHRYGVVSLTGLEEFGRQVFDRLWNAIRKELALPESPAEEASADPLAVERGYHERFMESRLRVYVGRESLQQALTTFANGDGEQPALVTGPSGSGKSAALAKFARDYAAGHPEVLIIPHFVGASPSSTGLRQTLHRFCSILKREFSFEEDVPPDTNSLITTFREFVTQVPADRRVLLVIDALNQLDESENAQQLNWLPWQFPAHVKVIVSCIDDPGREELVLQAFTHRQHERIDVPPLSDQDRIDIVKQIPSLSAKALNPRQVQLLLSNPATQNPLFLLVALEELRGFGSFEQLNRRIEQFPRGEEAVTELFVQVIHRLQDEFDEFTVYEVLSLLASARRGLSDRELLDLIEGTSVAMTDSSSDLFPILRQLRPYLQHRGELRDFFHRNLYKAVDQQFLPDDAARSAAHSQLATYFADQDYWLESVEEQRARARRLPPTLRPANVRKLDELPWQFLQAADWQNSEQLLTDAAFLEAKVEAGMVFDLNADYTAALDLLPERQPERALERQRRDKLRRYGDQLVKYAVARGQGVDLPEPPDTRPTQELMRLAEARSADESREPSQASPAARIQTFASFVSSHGHLLQQFPDQALPIAFNHAAGGPVAEGAERLLALSSRLWLRRHNRPLAPPRYPICQRTLAGHAWGVVAVALTSDGQTAVSGSMETLFVWDVASGKCLRSFDVHTGGIHRVPPTPDRYTSEVEYAEVMLAVALTPDGTTAVSASDDEALGVWDVVSGKYLRTLEGHRSAVKAVALTPDGRTAVSASEDKTLRVWNVASGECLRTLQGHTSAVEAVALTPDGNTAVSASWDSTLRVWDVDGGKCLRILEGHTLPVRAVALTPDGHTAISASGNDHSRATTDNTLRVWDIACGECLETLTGHTKQVNAVELTPDGKTAVSASNDKSLRIWDVTSGECLRTLAGHSDGVRAVALSPDGKTAVSASNDETLRVWDVAGGEHSRTIDEHTLHVVTVALTPDGHTAISTSVDNTLRVWDVDSGKCLRTLRGHTDRVWGVAVTFDGQTAVSASHDETLRVWAVATGECLRILAGHTRVVRAVALTPDGKTAVSASNDETLRVWNVASGECLRKLTGHVCSVVAVALTPDGKIAVSSDSIGMVRVWDVASGECLRTFAEHSGGVDGLAFLPDGKTFVSASTDYTLKVWDVASGNCLRTLTGHTHFVGAVALTPDGKIAISASRDQTLRVWDVASGAGIGIYMVESECNAVAVATNNRVLACTDSGQLHLLTLCNWP